VDAFMAVRPLPNMFDWIWNNSGASVEESTGAFIFQARLWSAQDTDSLPEIEDQWPMCKHRICICLTVSIYMLVWKFDCGCGCFLKCFLFKMHQNNIYFFKKKIFLRSAHQNNLKYKIFLKKKYRYNRVSKHSRN